MRTRPGKLRRLLLQTVFPLALAAGTNTAVAQTDPTKPAPSKATKRPARAAANANTGEAVIVTGRRATARARSTS